ncbi:N-acetyltransferase, partial [Alistipes sp. OttesenSCG-928-B03]|nr:N-acetyltransferase [Alistipes sp. OttesenSCG-928-B03]
MKIKHITEHGGGYFMADDNGEECGRMTYSNAGPDKFIIDHTEVRRARQGEGVGRKMVNAAVEFARGNDLKIIP